MILSQAFNESALKNLNHAALLDLGKATSYGEMKKRISQLSYLFLSEIPANEKVAFISRNSVAFALTFFALSNTGNPFLLLNPEDSDESIIKDLKNLGIKWIMASPDQISRLNRLQRESGYSLNIVEMEKKRGGEYDASFSSPPERPLKDTDPVMIVRHEEYGEERMYTFFNHKQIITACTGLRKFYRLMPSDRLLTTMNWQHPFSLTHGLLLPLITGSTACIDPDSPSIEEFVDYLATERISRFVGTPKFYFQLLSYCASKKYPLPGVKSITLGHGSLSLTLRKTFQLLKIPVLRCYGRSEAIWSIAMDSIEEALDIEKAKSRPCVNFKCKVLDAAGDEIAGPSTREGPLAVMSETVSTGFFHPDEELAAQTTRNKIRGTWLYTGEIARLEGEGAETTIAVLGKATDMIAKGKNYLSPRRIDDIAKSLPGITDAAGFVREDKNGSVSFACAVVVESKTIRENDILQAICAKLPNEIHPRTVHIVERIPKDAFESVNRTALRKQLSGL